MKHCIYCNTLMAKDAIYCPKCGKKQVNRQHPQPQERPTNVNYYYNQPRTYHTNSVIARNPGIFFVISIITEIVGLFMFGWIFGLVGAYIGNKLELNVRYHDRGYGILIAGVAETVICIIYIAYKFYVQLRG